MRTRTRKSIPYATLLNHFEWASARNHGREMRKARAENATLKLTLMGLKQSIGVLALVPCLVFAQPTPPLPMSVMQRQAQQNDWQPPRPHWYSEVRTNTEALVVRRTVTSNVVCMTIWWEMNPLGKSICHTNYEVKSSNVVSVVTNVVLTVTNSSPVVPE